HISLQISSMSKSVETKTNQMRPKLWRAPPEIPLNSYPTSGPPRLRFDPSAAPVCITALPVKGVLRLTQGGRKRFFEFLVQKIKNSRNLLVFMRFPIIQLIIRASV
ncbi:hypothetical protein, partial [Yoonia sp. 208BN28-4]|uniref:hypothetical protein n=1 Tax=Yoonia sp. 208BN28-4 TaxID=3126505 RepID=UPI00309B57BF